MKNKDKGGLSFQNRTLLINDNPAKKHVFAIIMLLTMSVGSVIAEDVEFGNWLIVDERDPFDPRSYHATAVVLAMPNSEIIGNFALHSQCSRDDPDELITIFRARSYNFNDDSGGWGRWIKVPIKVVFEGGTPRTFKVRALRLDDETWHPFRDSDQLWLESGMQSSDRMYVRWQRDRKGSVTAEFDLDGRKAAIAEIKRRCASPPS